jgi:hypothetical protein
MRLTLYKPLLQRLKLFLLSGLLTLPQLGMLPLLLMMLHLVNCLSTVMTYLRRQQAVVIYCVLKLKICLFPI